MGKAERLLILVFTIVAGLSGAICAYISVATYYNGRELKVIPPATGTTIMPSIIGPYWPSVGWGFLALAFYAVSIFLILYGTRRGVWRQNRENFIPLTKAVETLIQERNKQNQIKGMGYFIQMRNDPDKLYETFVKLISKYIDIYGKRPYSSFDKLEKISEDMILMGDFRNLGSKLYFNNELLFNDLVIRESDNLDKAIQKIASSDNLLQW